MGSLPDGSRGCRRVVVRWWGCAFLLQHFSFSLLCSALRCYGAMLCYAVLFYKTMPLLLLMLCLCHVSFCSALSIIHSFLFYSLLFYLSIYLCINLSIYVSIYLSMYQSIYLSIELSNVNMQLILMHLVCCLLFVRCLLFDWKGVWFRGQVPSPWLLWPEPHSRMGDHMVQYSDAALLFHEVR